MSESVKPFLSLFHKLRSLFVISRRRGIIEMVINVTRVKWRYDERRLYYLRWKYHTKKSIFIFCMRKSNNQYLIIQSIGWVPGCGSDSDAAMLHQVLHRPRLESLQVERRQLTTWPLVYADWLDAKGEHRAPSWRLIWKKAVRERHLCGLL